jgi:hypothetical protein
MSGEANPARVNPEFAKSDMSTDRRAGMSGGARISAAS